MISPSLLISAAPLVVAGVFFHRVADWIFQSEWMAVYKTSLKHPAAWVHSGIHTLIQVPLFGWNYALLIGAAHILIDTRKPLIWWGRLIKQTEGGEVGLHVAFNRDQVVHEVVVAVVAVLYVISK